MTAPSAALGHLEALLGGLDEADGLEGVVDAAADESLDGLDGVALGGVDDVGGAELAGGGELVLEHVDGDGRGRRRRRRRPG